MGKRAKQEKNEAVIQEERVIMERLRAEMKARKIKINVLAAHPMLKMRVSTLSSKLRMDRPVHLRDILAICAALNINPCDLVPGGETLKNIQRMSIVDLVDSLVKEHVRDMLGGKTIEIKMGDGQGTSP